MRELTKSMLSFSWALPLFGMKQMMEITLPRDASRPFGRATDSFEAVTQAARGQLGSTWDSAFRAGDQLQRGLVDLMFSFFSLDALNPNRMMQMSSDAMQRSMGAVGQMAGQGGAGRDWGQTAQSAMQSGMQAAAQATQAAVQAGQAAAQTMTPGTTSGSSGTTMGSAGTAPGPSGWRVSRPTGI